MARMTARQGQADLRRQIRRNTTQSLSAISFRVMHDSELDFPSMLKSTQRRCYPLD